MATQKFTDHFKPDSDLMKFLKRDSRWLSLLIAITMTSLGVFLFAMLIYAIGGVAAYGFCMLLMVVSLLLMFPGIIAVYKIHISKKKKPMYAPAPAMINPKDLPAAEKITQTPDVFQSDPLEPNTPQPKTPTNEQ